MFPCCLKSTRCEETLTIGLCVSLSFLVVDLLGIYGKDSIEMVPVVVVSLPWKDGLFVSLLTYILE